MFIVPVNVFHDYVLLWFNYFLAVPVTELLLSFDYAVSHMESLVKFSTVKSYSSDTVERRLSSHS